MSKSFRLDFVGIGCARAGTGWISHCLQEHPQICMAPSKELFYFCTDPQWGPFSNYFRGEAWLSKQFVHAQPGQSTGEFTPVYLSAPESPKLLKQASPEIKLLVSYRNPVDRLYSMYHMLGRLYKLPPTFEEFIAECPQYIESGYYHTLTQRFLAYFPTQQFHFMIFDDIREAPAQMLAHLYAFLEVDPQFIPSKANTQINAGTTVRSVLLRNLIDLAVKISKRAILGIDLNRLINSLGVHNLGRRIGQLNTKETSIPPLNQKTRARLIEVYAQENLLLGELIGRDLTKWNTISS
jgi:hypothetical protein